MGELKFVELACQRCGGELEEISEEYVCKHCGKKWVNETLYSFTDMLEACEEALRAQRVADIANLRRLLWEETHKEYVSNFEVERLCNEIRKFLPQDFYAGFYLGTCSESKTALSDFLYSVDARKHYDDARLILDYLLKALKPEWTMGVSNFIEKLKDVDLEFYHSYRTKFEDEYDKIEECIFEPAFPRDAFIAYSSKDMPKVCELVAALEEENLTCFVAARNLRHGSGSVEKYEESLRTAIDHSTVLVFVSSDNSRSVRCDAYKELEYVNKACGNKPRVELVVKNYSGRASERFFEDFFRGLEYCTDVGDVAERVAKIIMDGGVVPESETDTEVETEFEYETEVETIVEPEPVKSDVTKKLKRVRILIETGDFEKAEERLTKIENDEAERVGECEIAEVYHLKMLIDYSAKSDEHLTELLIKDKIYITGNKNYLLAKNYAEDSGDEAELAALLSIKTNSQEGIKKAEAEAKAKAEEEARLAREAEEERQRKIKEEQDRIAEEKRRAQIARDFEIKDGVIVKYKGSGGNVEIPDDVTSIGSYVFKNFSTIKSVTIPDGVTSIGYDAFYKCTALKSINIPKSVESIEGRPFFCCSSLTSITVDAGNRHYKSKDGNLYSYDGKTLIQYAGGKKASSFAIPGGVTSIGGCAFCGCTPLTNITLPEGLKTIGESAFASLTALASIIIPNSVTTIGELAFYSCTSLKSVTIPKSVATVGYKIFSDCSNLTKINCEAETKPRGWSSDWHNECKAQVIWGYGQSNTAQTVSRPATSAVKPKININDFVIKKGVLLKYKGKGGDVAIPASVREIGKSAFKNCLSLKSVVIPDSVTSIGWYAFEGCSMIKEVTIPDSVTAISDSPFKDCSSLANINVGSENKKYKSVDGNLYSRDGKTLIQYAKGKYSVSFDIPDGVTAIGDSAFWNCRLTNVTIPDSVTSIGGNAFCGCRTLAKVTIPERVNFIGTRAFSSCDKLNIYCRVKKPFFGLPKGWDKEWLGTKPMAEKIKVYWNYRG